ncbi:hypothetical protein Tco_0527799 [Tanacetum coccineum]
MRVLGANGDVKGSTMGLLIEVNGGVKHLCSHVFESKDTIDESEFAGFRGLSSFNWRELVHVGNGIKSVVFNEITTWVDPNSLIWRRESSHDQQDRIHRAMDKGDWIGHA